MNRYVISEKDLLTRIDKFLCDNLQDISRSQIQRILKEENVLVNNAVVKPSYKLNLNDEVIINFIPPKEIDILAENIQLDIVYDDEDIIIVNKPKGMVVHPAPSNYSGTLVNALMYQFKDSLSGINGDLRPGIVHRIDKDTSGLLVVTKNDRAHLSLSEQFKNHSIERKYLAIVHNNIKADFGTIDKPLNRDKNDRKKRAIDLNNGKKAVTHFKVLERFGKYTLVECSLETGRTHQIRVHMASIGHGILGDEVYTNYKLKFNLDGQTLHAKTLGFVHPSTNEKVFFNSDLPEYFENILNLLRG